MSEASSKPQRVLLSPNETSKIHNNKGWNDGREGKLPKQIAKLHLMKPERERNSLWETDREGGRQRDRKIGRAQKGGSVIKKERDLEGK